MIANDIEIQGLREEEGIDPYGWWARGHHDPEAFIAAANDQWGDPCVYHRWITASPSAAQVRHEHWRYIPEPNGPGYAAKAVPGTRGAFPVTVLEWA